jgi:hypothetical protein
MALIFEDLKKEVMTCFTHLASPSIALQYFQLIDLLLFFKFQIPFSFCSSCLSYSCSWAKFVTFV